MTTAALFAVTVAPAPAARADHPTTPHARTARPLAGRVIVIDPGHQLGNSRFPSKINRPVNAGGFDKACNTTGTATNAGYPEATFAFRVATKLRHQLTRLGARVIMTRTRNSTRLWGPCVDVRGKLGNRGFRGLKRPADLKISIHGDGAASSAHGFHVIVPRKKRIAAVSKKYGKDTRAALRSLGFDRATYVAAGTGLMVRGDLGTLNRSTIPTVMVELGNMRNASDARAMTSRKGQKRYARGLLLGIRDFLHD